MSPRESLGSLLEPWVASLGQRSPNTARSYREAAHRFLAVVGEQATDPGSMQAYLGTLASLAPASRAHHVSAVRSFIRFAQRQGSIPTSPLDLLQRPRVAITSGQRYLVESELRALLAAAAKLSPAAYAAVLLMATTGLRVSEAAAAEWRHLFRDPDGRLGLLVIGKGGKERVVKVSDRLFLALAELHGSQRLDAKDRTPLIPDRERTRYGTRAFGKMVRKAAAGAELDKPVSPHWLRHTAGTLAAKGGADVFTIQEHMGHSRLETSQRYIHMARGLEKGLSDYLPDL